jgi:hypothetical protein
VIGGSPCGVQAGHSASDHEKTRTNAVSRHQLIPGGGQPRGKYN